jgi:hypothetical protein
MYTLDAIGADQWTLGPEVLVGHKWDVLGSDQRARTSKSASRSRR